MTASVYLPDVVAQTIAGERAAHRLLACVDGRVMSGDELLEAIQEVASDDGLVVPGTPRLRGFFRVVQKRLEGQL